MLTRSLSMLLVLVVLNGHAATLVADEAATENGPAETLPQAPDTFKVKFETTCGDFVVECHREWAPLGADRFHEMVTKGFFDDSGFFRVVPGFVVQFGLNADPAVQAKWTDANLKDEPVVKSNKRGFMTYAKSALPNSRTTQVFINFGDNSRLDRMGFAPFAEVVEGMEIVDKISAAHQQEPDQQAIKEGGTQYLKDNFPKLDYIQRATVLEPEQQVEGDKAVEKQ